MNDRHFSWRARGRSFIYAWEGIKSLVKSEHNAWLHLSAAALAVFAGIMLHINAGEWVAVVMCIGAVLMAEGFNSAIEAVCDLVSPAPHPLVKKAKDIAAGAVLIMAASAFVTGCIIFIPKIIALI